MSVATPRTTTCPTCGAPPGERHRLVTEPPSDDTIREWIFDQSMPEATDGCEVEPDGRCEHGHRSWLLVLGLV